MKLKLFMLFFIFSFSGSFGQAKKNYYTNSGEVSFSSEAQQEIIKASSSMMHGIVDVKNRTFVFKISMRTFHGFNSALQQEHFNEKYIETEEYPDATYIGKIIEDIDLSIPGSYEIRAKGTLKIHGIEKEQIIRCNVRTDNNIIHVDSKFNILLSDHDIKIPKVVHEKIADNINVEIHLELVNQK